MSYVTPSSRNRSRLSTRVRTGVAVIAACFVTSPVYSNPLNPTVVNGTATFNQAGSVLTVTNSTGAIINWDKFSIKTGETTHFAQTAASSTVLNRVLNDPTVIYGTLSSNGQVWLVNPAGIMVGPGGLINTAGFVASTLAIRNEDFLAGRHLFVNDGSAKNVINQGEIRTPSGGSVYLIGSSVTNEGIITTPQGETILAAGATVSLIDSATPGVKVDITGSEGNATNLGTITAEAGRIGIAGVIVRNSGTLNASSVVNEGGRIFLKASQDAYVDGNGRIVTTGTKGGSVEVLGNRVAVMDNAVIDASGTNGGGRIMIGGDYQGKNPEIQNASITYFGPDATLKADATEVGDGGTVIVWADDTTRAYGSISARGGAAGGNGGFVETSGKNYLAVDGIRVDTRAPQGNVGTWLLDPNDITIVASGAPTNGTYGGDPWQFVATGSSTVGWDTLVAELGTTDVNVTTSDGNITIGADQTYNRTNSLYLLAGGDINAVGRTVTNVNSGGIGLVAGWDSSSGIGASATPYGGAGPGAINASGATFSTVGGDITLLARNNITVGSLITKGFDGGAGSNGGDAGSVTVHSQSGDINVTTVDASGGNGGDGGEGGVGSGGSGGSVTLTSAVGNIEVNGNITTKGGDGGISTGYGFSGGAGGSAGTIMLTASSGSIALTNAQLSANGGNGGYGTRGCSDCGYEAGSGGTIMLNSYGGITMTGGSISANGGNGGNAGFGYAGYAGGGGSITLSSSYGGISMTGSSISANGGNGGSAGNGDPAFTGYAGYAGGGGSILLDAASSITLTSGQITARGGNGGHSFGYGYGTDGGGGGSIMLFSNIAGDITLTGTTLNVQGGTGGNSTYGGYSGGWGGSGGFVNLQTVNGSIALNSGSFIYANGGMGGSGSNDDAYNGYGAYSGGRGGDGGNVTLGANGPLAGISMSGSGITASGGGGGAGGAGGFYVGYGGDGGDGGEGGSVSLVAARAIQSASVVINGGAGGAGGAGVGVYGGGLVGAIGGGGSADLFSQYGGAADGLAISADVVGSDFLTATVSGGATNGGISIRNFGSQPGFVSIVDFASSQSAINFFNSGNLTLDGSQSFSTSFYGSTQIASGGILNVASPLSGFYDLNLGGNTIDVNADVFAYNNIQLAATTININSDGFVQSNNQNVALVTPLAGGTINLYGGQVEAYGTLATPSTINGIPYAGIAFVAQNLNAYGGTLKAAGTTGGISGLVTGNITLDGGSSFVAGDDIELVLAGSTSTLSLSNNSYLLSDVGTMIPATIYLDFLGRGSGGVMIDGVATTTSIPGGSGFFVLDHSTPAVAGIGLAITYANAFVVDPCVSNPDLCKPPSPTSTPIDPPPVTLLPLDPTQPLEYPGYTIGGTEDSFGGEEDAGKKSDEAKDEKKDEKSSQKKVAQCSA